MESAMIYEKQDEKYFVKRSDFSSYQQYCYMVQKYTPQDFRYPFTQYYAQVLKARLNWNLYTCKIYYDPNLPVLLNVVLYLEEPVSPYILTQQLEKDKDHLAFSCFYETLERFPLPAVKEHRLRIFVENADYIRIAGFTLNKFGPLRETLRRLFPFVETADFMSVQVCVILRKGCDLKRLSESGQLERLRRICYQSLVNRTDFQRELPYGRFHIKVDNSGIYQERGSRFFFETEEYFNALTV